MNLSGDLVDDGDYLTQITTEHPLRFARLWDRPMPRTSQRRCFQSLGEVATIICGGNRSGKSAGASQFAVATALGSRDPDAIAWCRNNGVDIDSIPARPGKVWAIALDSGDSATYVRPNITQYLPAGCKWRNQYGNGRAKVTLPAGGTIEFLSVDMGRDGFQGAAIDLAFFDEEPGSRPVVNESLMRLVDLNGRILISMTPLKGLTWIYDRWIANTPADVRVHYLHGVDNPHIPTDALAKMLRQYGTHERDARARGEWTTMEGRVYAEWGRHMHVVPAFDVPADDWTLTGCMDFGTRAPAVFLLLAHDHRTDTVHVIGEHYKAEFTISQHARAIKQLLAGRECMQIVVDPEDRGARLSLARDHGITTTPAKKGPGSVRSGINAVCERLAPGAADGLPALVVHEGKCPNLVREIEGYIWDDRAGGTKDAPKPGQSDHALDALRYGIVSIGSGTFGAG